MEKIINYNHDHGNIHSEFWLKICWLLVCYEFIIELIIIIPPSLGWNREVDYILIWDQDFEFMMRVILTSQFQMELVLDKLY